MNNGLSTSAGFAILKDKYESTPGSLPGITNLTFTGTEQVIGSVTVGSDSWECRTVENQYHEKQIKLYKNGTYDRFIPGGTTGTFGFAITNQDSPSVANQLISVFVVYIPDKDPAETNEWYQQLNGLDVGPGPGVSYSSTIIYIGNDSILQEDREWDDSPSVDPENDPFNELPQGGEYADLGSYSETFMQYLTDLPEPESLSYGKFVTAYQLDSQNLTDIGDFLFDAGFWTSLKNKFEGLSDPISFIISAIELPFTLGVLPCTFKIGGVEVTDGEGDPISCYKHTGRYLKYSFGTITLKEVWGTAKDYTDCDISIFLPYVGMRQIDAELAVNASLTLACIVDVWTGDINYLLEINNTGRPGTYVTSSGVPYHWSGNCGNKIPIGKVDPSTPILNVAASLGSMALGVGAMFAGGIGTAAAAETAGMVTAGSAISGGAGAAMITSGGKDLLQQFSKGFSPLAQSSGNISGAIGFMDYQYPYLVIKRSVPKYPNGWRGRFGAPRFQSFQGVSMTGFTQFADIHLTGMADASESERLELERILKEEGVIL